MSLDTQQCPRCGFRAVEHDPVDLRCPDDEDHARANREEWNEDDFDERWDNEYDQRKDDGTHNRR